jgi:hypothetical protein
VRASSSVAYQRFNCIVLLVVVSVSLGAVFFVRDRVKPGKAEIDTRVSSYREKFADLKAYTRMPTAEVAAFLDEQDAMAQVGLQCEPWVQFRNPEFQGRLLNTNERGFRATRAPEVCSGKPVRVHVFGVHHSKTRRSEVMLNV